MDKVYWAGVVAAINAGYFLFKGETVAFSVFLSASLILWAMEDFKK